MSSHVHLEGLGATSGVAESKPWKCLVSDSLQHTKLLGMKLSRFLLQPFAWNHSKFTEGLDSSRKINSWCSSLFFLCLLFLTEVPKPAYLGGYGHWCLPGRHQETDSSVYSKSSLCTNKHITMCEYFPHFVIPYYSLVWTKWLLLCYWSKWICAAPP